MVGTLFLTFMMGLTIWDEVSGGEMNGWSLERVSGSFNQLPDHSLRLMLLKVGGAGYHLSILAHSDQLRPYLQVRFGDKALNTIPRRLLLITEPYQCAHDILVQPYDLGSPMKLKVLEIRSDPVRYDEEMLPLERALELLLPNSTTRSWTTALAEDLIAGSKNNNKRKDLFSGSFHAETQLLSLAVMARDPRYQDTLPKGLRQDLIAIDVSTLGVSKRCCPVCSIVTHWVQLRLQRGYIRTGSCYQEFPACSLPPWLPEEILDEILELVATMCRQILSERLINMQDAARQDRGSASPEGARSSGSFQSFEN
ncbi:hypothetical protein BJ508DRAFT_113699 [Ascobolus immersus RN42]|uniref:Uncharacterized protein n=1 Tax=Ascobolus immersus RN42 TaxID=1160509 RepID=A0A3N4I5H7_ASCIM|nr:hypothetical protein BJ508DRAFT_113699 [Ascobolus immersus RN42]